ncbi:hypothetical protein GO287_03667 [Ralstonia solanacearum]|uniref:hypothetical protein n=1 Tax=Ralstonia pseudosolanacearum TaxID=1310165 RepID=UPI001401C3B3|nr:hypothetical protein [Ralstonia pseudosolanacearum]KAF3458126.1 hypothetical protein GO278_005081 [Ralstonia solanacearum]NKG01748.1 hypothetical protein [Ralstonia solanacearum]UNJ33119.1 hypothetical protein MNY32_26080 [Ralstonia pseudosolanacearum]
MSILSQLHRTTHAIARAYVTARSCIADTRQAIHTQVDRHRTEIRSVLLALWMGTIPGLARAGIWNGGLCSIYQQVMDNELIMIVSLAAFGGAFIVWLLDDGHSKIKQNVLRGFVGTLALINMPILWSQLFNKGVACTA